MRVVALIACGTRALLGAAIGCAVGHHYATKHYREQHAQWQRDHSR